MSDAILAKAFSYANDREQAEILNLMSRELFVICEANKRWTATEGFDGQLCSMSKYINKDGESFLRRLLEFVELRKKDMPQ